MTGRTDAQRSKMQINMGMMMVMPMSAVRGVKCAEMLPVKASCFRACR